tara:strand:+ start:1393 stop:1581 length:189 start_codon:yes stop_codon:yes gene_type:complete
MAKLKRVFAIIAIMMANPQQMATTCHNEAGPMFPAVARWQKMAAQQKNGQNMAKMASTKKPI